MVITHPDKESAKIAGRRPLLSGLWPLDEFSGNLKGPAELPPPVSVSFGARFADDVCQVNQHRPADLPSGQSSKRYWLWVPPASSRPCWLDCLDRYSWKRFLRDGKGGVLVGLAGLPVTLGICLSAGIPAGTGLVSAAAAGAVVSLAGGSRFQIAGPSAAFVLFTADLASRYGTAELAFVGLLTGLLLILFGWAKLAYAVKLLPLPAIVGLLNGIALVVAASQLEFLLGFPALTRRGDVASMLEDLWGHRFGADPGTIAISLVSIGLLALARKMSWRIPGALLVPLLVAGAVWLFQLPVETIGSQASGLFLDSWPSALSDMRLGLWTQLVVPALMAAVVISTESLLSVSAADSIRPGRYDSGLDIIGQGVANVVAAISGGMLVSGAPGRTVLNARSGSSTPLAGVVCAAVLFGIAEFGGVLVRAIPLPLLGAVLVDLALTTGGWREIPHILHRGWTDRLIWAAVLILTVGGGITVGTEAALALSLVYYARRLSPRQTGSERGVLSLGEPAGCDAAITVASLPELSRVAASRETQCRAPVTTAPVVLFRADNLSPTNLPAIQEIAEMLRQSARVLVLYDVRPELLTAPIFERLAAAVEARNIVGNLPSAVLRAHQLRERFFGLGERLADSLGCPSLHRRHAPQNRE